MQRSAQPHPPTSCDTAAVEPLAAEQAGRVLSLTCKLLLNLSLLLIPALLAGMLLPIFAVLAWTGTGRAVSIAAVAVPGVFALQIAWAGTYPEWPMNRFLARRLRRRVAGRLTCDPAEPAAGRWIQTARMVEWVPREHWSVTKLDSAKDIMLIEVNPSGVAMEGDHARYFFPASSIIDVRVTSIRPLGCFHRLHFATLIVRTEVGPQEFPLAYRDHRFGRLRSRRRKEETESLCRRIREIASGGEFNLVDPEHHRFVRETRRRLPSEQAAAAGGTANPYAPPKVV